MATYEDYVRRMGGRTVKAGEDWKDVHQQVMSDYAANHPNAPVPPPSSGGGEAGTIGPATDRAAAPQLGILPQAPSTGTSAAVPGLGVPTPGGPNGFMPAKKPAAGAPSSVAPIVAPSNAGVDGIPTGASTPATPSAAAIPAQAVQPKPANAGVDGIPTGGPEGWKGGAPNQAPKTAFGDLQATIQNQVEKAVWGSTLTPQPSGAATQKPDPAQASYSNEGRNYPTPASTANSPASTTGVAPPGKLTNLGAGTDAGYGAKRFDVKGQSPLFTNMTDDAGMVNNLSLMNRGAPTAQNQAAMNALLQRDAAERSQQVSALQFQDQVKQAQAIRDQQQPAKYDPNDLRDPNNIARHNFETSLIRGVNENARDYQIRAGALIDARKVFDTNAANTNAQQLAQQQLAATIGHSNRQLDQGSQRLGIEAGGLGIRQQQLANELATGEQNRAVTGLSLDASKIMAGLQSKYMASSDGKERAQLAQTMRGLTGKNEPAEWGIQVTPTTKNADQSTTMGSVYKYNKVTGEVQEVTGNAREPVLTPEQFEALPRGATYTGPDGKRYRKT